MRTVRPAVFAIVLAGFARAAAADEVTTEGGVRTGSFHYVVAGVQTDPESVIPWPDVTKITSANGKVLFERGAAADPTPPDAGEMRGNVYVNEKLGLSLDVPSSKDVTAGVATAKARKGGSSQIIRAMSQMYVFEADLALDESAIKNKATALMFNHDFPNRMLLLVDPHFDGCKSDELLRRMAADEVRRYEESWASGDAKTKTPAPRVDEVVVAGEKGFRARGSIVEKARGGTAAGKAGDPEVKRERLIEVTIVRHGTLLVALLTEVTAPDDLVDSLLIRLRKIANSLHFQAR
jgi:hypothetical protein